MKIALINCPAWDVEFPPYQIALLSAELYQKGFNVRCFDFNRDFYYLTKQDTYLWNFSNLYSFWQSEDNIKKLFDTRKNIIDNFILSIQPYDIIGVSVQSLNYTFSIALARAIKEVSPEKIIIAGGPECFYNFNADFLMSKYCFDAICSGEGDVAFPELLNKIANNIDWNTAGFFIKKESGYFDCGNRSLVRDLNDLPFANYEFLDKKIDKVAISTSRGCINHCNFCQEKAHWSRYRWRSAESIIEEIVLLKKKFPCLNFVYFNDSLVNGHMREFERFCDLMIMKNIGVNWGGHILVRKEMTKEFLKKMSKAGAQRLNYGIESGSDKVLKLMNKTFTSELALKVLRDTKAARISFSVNLVVGHPAETEEEFSRTYGFFKQIKELTDCIHINPCLILKGNGLFINHTKWGIVLPANYVTEWYLADGTNNIQIRLDRVKALLQEKDKGLF